MRSTVSLSDRCHRRWEGILTALGVPSTVLNKKNQPCPACKGRDRFRWTNHNDNGGFYCTTCTPGDGIAFVQMFFGLDFKGAAERIEGVIGKVGFDTMPRREDGSQVASMRAVWNMGQHVTKDDPVGLYLAGRGIVLTEYPKAIRYVPRLRHDEGFGPAMIAQVLSPDAKAVNVHRTWLTTDGRKASLDQCRKIMAASIPDGSAIRLGPVEPVMGIAEGIETAFGARQRFGVPTWAVISEGGMQKFRPPAGVEELIIFADNDQNHVGQAAAYIAARDAGRWAQRHGKEIRVRIEIPRKPGTDWADDLTAEVDPQLFGERAAI